jgi:hypothetical protein
LDADRLLVSRNLIWNFDPLYPISGKSDPYATMSIQDLKQRSRTIHGNNFDRARFTH